MEKWFLIFFRSSSSSSSAWCAVSAYNVIRKICEYERHFLTNIDTNANVRSPHVKKKIWTQRKTFLFAVSLFHFSLLFSLDKILRYQTIFFLSFLDLFSSSSSYTQNSRNIRCFIFSCLFYASSSRIQNKWTKEYRTRECPWIILIKLKWQ